MLLDGSGLPHARNDVAKYRDLVDDLREIESLAETGRKMVLDQFTLSAAKLAEFGIGGGKLREKNRDETLKLWLRKASSRCGPAGFFRPESDDFVVMPANDSGYIGPTGFSAWVWGFNRGAPANLFDDFSRIEGLRHVFLEASSQGRFFIR